MKEILVKDYVYEKENLYSADALDAGDERDFVEK